jgi:hypothetical protein
LAVCQDRKMPSLRESQPEGARPLPHLVADVELCHLPLLVVQLVPQLQQLVLQSPRPLQVLGLEGNLLRLVLALQGVQLGLQRGLDDLHGDKRMHAWSHCKHVRGVPQTLHVRGACMHVCKGSPVP